jgi:hypothetical protein
MLLTRSHFDVLADAVASKLTPDIFAAFHAESATIKRQIVSEIAADNCLGFIPEEISEFIVAMAAEANAASPKTFDVYAIAAELGVIGSPGIIVEVAPIVWAKPKPPKLYPDLVMRWPDEYAQLTTMAGKIPFAAIADREWSRNAVHEALGLGGYLDYLLGRQIPASDPTMDLFHMGINTMLRALHGEWFDEEGVPLTKLPEGVSSASTEALTFASDLEDRLHRKAVAAASAAKRREAAIAEKTASRYEAFNILATATGWDGIVNGLSLAPFEKVYAIITSVPFGTKLVPAGSTWLTKAEVAIFHPVYPISTPEHIEFTEQFVLYHVAKRLPSWFKTTQDGTMKIRRAPLKARKLGLDRPTRSLHKRLLGLIEKHTETKVGDALLQLAGSVLSWADITASTAMSKAK